MLIFRGAMSETCKEVIEVAARVARKAVKNMATIAFLVAVMPPMFVVGCVGTATIFVCETGGKIVEVAGGIYAQRKRRKR